MDMRTILMAMLVAAGIGLAGTSGGSAAPVNSAAILDAADAIGPMDQVQHWRWGSRGRFFHGRYRSHWRWGSRARFFHSRYRSHWRWGSRARFFHSRYRSHWRWGSRGRVCHFRFRSGWGRC